MPVYGSCVDRAHVLLFEFVQMTAGRQVLVSDSVLLYLGVSFAMLFTMRIFAVNVYVSFEQRFYGLFLSFSGAAGLTTPRA